MGQTLTEKILSAHTDGPVRPGEFAEVRVDVVLANDVTAPIAIRSAQEGCSTRRGSS
jgi:3-isopropylmalate/(R)-2-methylmalate dehydratase large subunit